MLAVQLKFAEWATGVGCTPIPDKVIETGEFAALLVTLTLPVAPPVAAGAKVTFRVAASPGDKVIPDGIPLTLYPAPEMATLEIARLELPTLVSVTGSVLLLPTFTLLKFKVDALATSAPGEGALGGAGSGGEGDTGGAVTVMVASANLVRSALLVAVIVAAPGLAGAVNSPVLVMLPAEAAQVTDFVDVVPRTLARN